MTDDAAVTGERETAAEPEWLQDLRDDLRSSTDAASVQDPPRRLLDRLFDRD